MKKRASAIGGKFISKIERERLDKEKRLKKDADEAKKRLQSVLDERDNLHSLNEVQAERLVYHENQVIKFQMKYEDAASKLLSLRIRLNDRNQKISCLEENEKQMEIQGFNLTETISKHQATIDHLKKVIKNLEAHVKDLQEDLFQKNTTIENLQKREEDYAEEICYFEDFVSKASSNEIKLQKNIAKLEETNNILQRELSNASNEKIEHVKMSKMFFEERLKLAHRTLCDLTSENESLRTENELLTEENVRLRQTTALDQIQIASKGFYSSAENIVLLLQDEKQSLQMKLLTKQVQVMLKNIELLRDSKDR